MRVVVEAERRLPSMEREPKTLSLDELNYAREAALHVLITHSSQDAARIFNEGLKPVLVAGSNSAGSDHSDDHVFDPDAFVDDHDHARHRPLRRATAPF